MLSVLKIAGFCAGNVLVVSVCSGRHRRYKDHVEPARVCGMSQANASTTDETPAAAITETLVESSRLDCGTCKSLANTVKKVDMHIIVCHKSEWGNHVEDEAGSFIHYLSQTIEDQKINKNISIKVKLTACDRPNSSDNVVDVMVYPEKKMYHIPENSRSSIEAFVTHLFTGTSNHSPFPVEDVPWKQLILVCCHMSRDKRCGRAGPILIAEFERQLALGRIENIAVLGSSHIGGHEYAGTLIVLPEGKYFGYVTKNRVPLLLDYVTTGTDEAFDKIKDICYRGQCNVTW